MKLINKVGFNAIVIKSYNQKHLKIDTLDLHHSYRNPYRVEFKS